MLPVGTGEVHGHQPQLVRGPVFDASLAALAPFGRLASYGAASRVPASAVDPSVLMAHSTAVLGFWLAHCLSRPEMIREPVAELLQMVADGRLRAVVGGIYPLSEARRAHEDIRGRRTTGKLVLDPAR